MAGFFTLIFVVAILAVTIWPVVIILRRMGFSGWWTLLVIVPFGSLVGLWVLSQTRWPKLDVATGALGKTFE